MKEESFESRYIIKIISSIGIAVLNIIIQMILPRAFTVEEFGYYTYNLNVFTSVVMLANLSTSNALMAKFSRRNDEIGLVYFYLIYYGAEILILSIGLTLLYSTNLAQDTFAGQTLFMVVLGLETAAATKLLGDIISIFDAMAIAKISALFQIGLKILVCVFSLLCYIMSVLNLYLFYIGQLFITILISSLLLCVILKYQRSLYQVKIGRITSYIKEFTEFCSPLVVANIFTQIITILMNWCLLRFSGTTEQAMFGAAWQLNTLVTYVFSPYAELSKREYAIISYDKKKVSDFYENSIKRMFWLTSYFSCFIGFCSEWILRIIYGNQYIGASYVTLLIMFYTIYQAGGQMCGSFMLATEKTKMSAFLSIIGQIITAILVFFFQIPNILWPKGLGSVGIALVYLISNIIGVLLSLGFSSKNLGISTKKVLFIQLPPIMICSLLAFIFNLFMNILIKDNNLIDMFVKLLLTGGLYTFVVGGIIWKKPSFIAMDRRQLMHLLRIKNINNKIKR